MSTKKRGILLFLIGIFLGKRGIPILTHIIYIVLILLTMYFSNFNPINNYIKNYNKNIDKLELQLENCENYNNYNVELTK